jgi:hypothetical protein
MRKNNKKYFYIDLDIYTLKVINWGVSNTATLTGETENANVHRVFLTEGQYNKLIKYLNL